MIKLKIKLQNEMDLETIEKLTNELDQFEANVLLFSQEQEANCKSLINLLAIGIFNLKELDFIIDGNDEESVCTFLKKFFV